MKLRVHKIIEKTNSEGVGSRFCIWVQGCSKHCKGCYAKNTWDKTRGELISVNEIFEKIKLRNDIEGVTFLGGEPFEQAESLSCLAEKIKNIGLSLITFTGNTYEELSNLNNKYVNKLLSCTDLLIDGEFQKENIDYSRPLIGSKNQRYLFLTDKYSMYDIEKLKNKVEIRISKSGKIFLNGMGDFDRLLKNLNLIKK